jgi:hypothetical protein
VSENTLTSDDLIEYFMQRVEGLVQKGEVDSKLSKKDE